jgi:hypothetical protein
LESERGEGGGGKELSLIVNTRSHTHTHTLSNRETADVSEPLLLLLLSRRVAFHKGGRDGERMDAEGKRLGGGGGRRERINR